MAWLRENNLPAPEFRFVTQVDEAGRPAARWATRL